MLQKELEWKIRSIIEKITEVLSDPDTPDYIKEILDDVKDMAQSILQAVDKGNIKIKE
ncbi:MAG: hypothetical protein KAU12_00460 [Candidatus Omnitrophica bacterium]|nr:hypothetical protein [Candidatus Omnitrophota bacterium]